MTTTKKILLGTAGIGIVQGLADIPIELLHSLPPVWRIVVQATIGLITLFTVVKNKQKENQN